MSNHQAKVPSAGARIKQVEYSSQTSPRGGSTHCLVVSRRQLCSLMVDYQTQNSSDQGDLRLQELLHGANLERLLLDVTHSRNLNSSENDLCLL